MKYRSLLLASAALAVVGLYGSTVSVVAPQAGAAKSVTVGNKASITLDAGKSATLKATASQGWAFAGWYLDYDAVSGSFSNAVALAKGADWRNPSANYVAGEDDVTLYARFVLPAEDSLLFDLAESFADVAADADDDGNPVISLSGALDMAVEFDSLTLPTVTIKGLPAGLSFDKSSLKISGMPKAPGVYSVSASAKNASGYSFSQIVCVRVENAKAEHVEGSDYSDLEVGAEIEEYLDEFFYINNPDANIKTVSLSGLPSGLSLQSEKIDSEVYYYVTGIPKKSGDYTVWCKVSFDNGTTESASAVFTVKDVDPYAYDGNVDFSAIEGCVVGDTISSADDIVFGEYDGVSKVGVMSVAGLPTGITATKVTSDDGTVQYVLGGMFTKAGEFAVSVKVAFEDFETEKIATTTLTRKVVVGDTANVYLSVGVLDPEDAPGCKATGSGVYAVGSVAKLAATAAGDKVFAGWTDYAGIALATGAQDYRSPSLSLTVANDVELDWYADFISKSEDYVDLGDLEGVEMVIDPASGEVVEIPFFVYSGSLPTLKFSGLPSGIKCAPSYDSPDEYVLSCNPSAAKLTPGRYKVTATCTNASRVSDTAVFEVCILNYKDDDIAVLDDYGVLTPDVAMTPISLSDAVNFKRGDTLAVSGLPSGVKYNDKSGAPELSGVPKTPGRYTITFTAKIVVSVTTNPNGSTTKTTRTAVATAFITVKDYPTVSAAMGEAAAAAGNQVTGVGSFKAGSKITLKAKAVSGWVFAGWGANSGVSGLAALNPSLSYVVGSDDLVEVGASFIEIRDDLLFVEDPGVLVVVKGAAFSTNLLEAITTRSMPTVSMSGLPSGLKFDAKTCTISGKVAASEKAGYFYSTLTAKNAGGYTFTRVFKFAIIDSPEAEIPAEPELANAANIDFSVLDDMYTGDFYPADGIDVLALYVDPSESGSDVASVTVTGLPTGLKSTVSIQDGTAEVLLYGTPTKAGRYTVKAAVSYADRSRASSEYAFIVQDGGSAWLDVDVFDASLGTVTGSGVYASGATVKLSARPTNGYVFAGWYEDDSMPFVGISEMDGVDYRMAAATFVFRRGMFQNDPPVLLGEFVAKAEDTVVLAGLDDVWEISPDTDSLWEFDVESASLPRFTVTGLPKGCTLDAAAMRFHYSSASQSQIVPGYYTVTLKAVNQSNVSAAAKLSVFVANKTTDAIGGLDSSSDAYPLCVGVNVDTGLIMPEVDVADGWKLAASGLPAGLSLKSDKDGDGNTYYYVAGVATKAATNTVTFTATKGTQKEVATVTVSVSALPDWAYGTYDGAYYEFDDSGTNAVGQVTATVSSAGKVSGKILKDGKSYPFSAASYAAFDPANGTFMVEVQVPWSTTDKEMFLLSVGEMENGLGCAFLEPVGDGAYYAEATQNAWLRKDFESIAFASGAKMPMIVVDSLTCKFGAKGVVSVAGTVDGVSVSGKMQATVVGEDAKGLHMRATLYFANSKFAGGAICIPIAVILSDEDGDGLLDTAVADFD